MEKPLTYDKSINAIRSNPSTSFWYEDVKNSDNRDYKTSFANLSQK